MVDQQQQEEMERAVKFAETSSASGVTLPDPAANEVMGWNAAGDDLENKTLVDLDSVSLSNANAQALGTAAPGTSADVSRTDHVHAMPGASDVGALANLVEDATPQLGGALDGQDNTMSAINLKDYGEVTQALSGTGNKTIDLTAGNSVTHTAFGAITWTFSNPTAADELSGITLSLITGGIGTMTFPTTVKWAGGTAPTLTNNSATFTTTFATDKVNITAHGFINGERVHVTSDDTLPAGLSANTIYFVINKDTNDFELSTTLGGSAVDITDDGTGTHTLHSGEDKLVFETDNAGATWIGALAVADAK
jgi:hypothetical protein